MIGLKCKLAVVVCGLGACCATAVAVWPAQAQAQPAPLGDVARRAREQKRQVPKAARVWTNDDLPGLSGAPVNVVGAAPAAPPSETAAPAPAVAPAPPADTAAQEAERRNTETELAAAKELLGRARKELDILRRDLNLQQQQYYSNPAYASDKAGKTRLDALTAQIKDKEEEVQQAQAKVAALQEKLEGLKRGSGDKKPAPPSMPNPES